MRDPKKRLQTSHGDKMARPITIANVVAQIAISGTVSGREVSAPQETVVTDLMNLGVDEASVTSTIESARERGIIKRDSRKLLSVVR